MMMYQRSYIFQVNIGFILTIGRLLSLNVIVSQTILKNDEVTHKPSVIFVPGYMGSQLYSHFSEFRNESLHCKASDSYTHIWVGFSEIVNVDCFTYRMKLYQDNLRSSMKGPEVGHVKAAKFGSLSSVTNLGSIHFPFLNYYEKLIRRLEKIGFKRDVDLNGAPYDFRLIPLKNELSLFNVNMRRLILKQYASHHNTKVTIVSHSFGSAVFRQFLATKDQQWKDQYIQSWISVAGALAGAAKVLFANTVGYVGKDWIPVRGNEFVANLMSTYPSAYFLQPSVSYFGEDIVICHIFVRCCNKKLSSYQAELTNGLSNHIYSLINRDIFTQDPPGVDFHCVYSNGTRTVNQITVGSSHVIDKSSKKTTDGDGTLSVKEMDSCRKIAYLNDGKTNSVHVLEGLKHNKILESRRLFELIQHIISN